jgi:hypothetical protein
MQHDNLCNKHQTLLYVSSCHRVLKIFSIFIMTLNLIRFHTVCMSFKYYFSIRKVLGACILFGGITQSGYPFYGRSVQREQPKYKQTIPVETSINRSPLPVLQQGKWNHTESEVAHDECFQYHNINPKSYSGIVPFHQGRTLGHNRLKLKTNYSFTMNRETPKILFSI